MAKLALARIISLVLPVVLLLAPVIFTILVAKVEMPRMIVVLRLATDLPVAVVARPALTALAEMLLMPRAQLIMAGRPAVLLAAVLQE